MTEAISDKIRNWVNSKLDSDPNYYSRTSRGNDLQNFLAHENEGKKDKEKLTPKQTRSNFYKIVESSLKNRNLDVSALKKNSNLPKFNSDMNARVNPEPQNPKDTNQQNPTGQPQIKTTGATIQTVPMVQENFDEESTAATINALWLMLTIPYPELEGLTDEEKKSLGKMWKSLFNRFFQSDKALFLIPTMATLGLLAPKLKRAREKKKARKESEKVPDAPKKEPREGGIIDKDAAKNIGEQTAQEVEKTKINDEDLLPQGIFVPKPIPKEDKKN